MPFLFLLWRGELPQCSFLFFLLLILVNEFCVASRRVCVCVYESKLMPIAYSFVYTDINTYLDQLVLFFAGSRIFL
jgi:hypothetical protein